LLRDPVFDLLFLIYVYLFVPSIRGFAPSFIHVAVAAGQNTTDKEEGTSGCNLTYLLAVLYINNQ